MSFLSEHVADVVIIALPSGVERDGSLSKDTFSVLEQVRKLCEWCGHGSRRHCMTVNILIPSGKLAVSPDGKLVGVAMWEWLLNRSIPEQCLRVDLFSTDIEGGICWAYRTLLNLRTHGNKAVYVVSQSMRARCWAKLFSVASQGAILPNVYSCRYGNWWKAVSGMWWYFWLNKLEMPALEVMLPNRVRLRLDRAGTR